MNTEARTIVRLLDRANQHIANAQQHIVRGRVIIKLWRAEREPR